MLVAMTLDPGGEPQAFFEVSGMAADHLYREGSAKASFWEALFGSSLRIKSRTRVSALPDGTRMFDVPLLGVEDALLQSAQEWMISPLRSERCREAATTLATGGVRVRLIGLQPRGTSIASFSMRVEPRAATASASPAIAEAFRSWFEAVGPAVGQKTLIPFGFTPHPSGQGLTTTL